MNHSHYILRNSDTQFAVIKKTTVKTGLFTEKVDESDLKTRIAKAISDETGEYVQPDAVILPQANLNQLDYQEISFPVQLEEYKQTYSLIPTWEY